MKKKKTTHPDIDFIGGARTPTEEDFQAISKFIRAHKAKHKRKAPRRKAVTKKQAV